MTGKNSNHQITIIDPPSQVRYHAKGDHLEVLVSHFERHGGDLDSFLCDIDDNSGLAVFCIEKRLREHTDSSLKERWDAAFELGMMTRLRLLQLRALRAMEMFDSSKDKESRVDLMFFKTILTDVIAASVTTAKQKAASKSERSTVLDVALSDMEAEEEV